LIQKIKGYLNYPSI